MGTNITIKYAVHPDGHKFFYQHWIPEKPRALVVFVHGLGDHIGRYQEFISRLTNDNFACALYDQRGHGRSFGKRGHIDKFEDWVNDLAGFVQFSQTQVPPGTPLFVVGYSLGGLISVNFLLLHTVQISGLVLISAAIIPALEIPEWKKKLAMRLTNLCPRFTIRGVVPYEAITSDPDGIDDIKCDPFFHRRITVRAVSEIAKNLELVMAMPHRIQVPMLMLAGENDSICDPDGTRQFAMRLSSSDKKYHIFPDIRHDLLHETGREEIIHMIETWLIEESSRAVTTEKQFALNNSKREEAWEGVSRL